MIKGLVVGNMSVLALIEFHSIHTPPQYHIGIIANIQFLIIISSNHIRDIIHTLLNYAIKNYLFSNLRLLLWKFSKAFFFRLKKKLN
jgi:hypothetical protein